VIPSVATPDDSVMPLDSRLLTLTMCIRQHDLVDHIAYLTAVSLLGNSLNH